MSSYTAFPSSSDPFSLDLDCIGGGGYEAMSRKRPAVPGADASSSKRAAPYDDEGYLAQYDGVWQQNQGNAGAAVYHAPMIATDYFYSNPQASTSSEQDYLPRPSQSHTPPTTDDQKFHVLTNLEQTPTESLAQHPGGSLMYTPESPEEYGGASTSSQAAAYAPMYNQGYQMIMPLPQFHRQVLPKEEVDEQKPQKNVHEIQRYDNQAVRAPPQRAKPSIRYNVSDYDLEDVYPTFGESTDPTDEVIIREVDGRLPSVGNRCKYRVTASELKRRIGSPENMNLSAVVNYLRMSKKKEFIDEMKRTMKENNIEIARMQRQRKHNSFSGLLEEDATGLAQDFDQLNKQHFPVEPVAQQMLIILLGKGHSLEQCIEMLKETMNIMEKIITILQSRQPAVYRKKEVLNGTALDFPYHYFNLVTHGFGHENSLTHYNTQWSVIRRAIEVAEEWKLRNQAPLMFPARDDEQPFALMSQDELVVMIAYKLHQGLSKTPVAQREGILRSLEHTEQGREVLRVFRVQNFGNRRTVAPAIKKEK